MSLLLFAGHSMYLEANFAGGPDFKGKEEKDPSQDAAAAAAAAAARRRDISTGNEDIFDSSSPLLYFRAAQILAQLRSHSQTGICFSTSRTTFCRNKSKF